jgi:hypothetical protein
MADIIEEDVLDGRKTPKLKKADVLSFKKVGRPISLDCVADEFRLMREAYFGEAKTSDDASDEASDDDLDAQVEGPVKKEKVLTADHFRRVGLGSGTHLLKLTTPRTALDQSILRVGRARSNEMPAFLPSVNAPDIPVAKIVHRPLEIISHGVRSVADHIMNPDDISHRVLGAFAEVFGEEALIALRDALCVTVTEIVSLPDAGDFPIIFLPRPGGGDIQATPVSPSENFMGFKRMADAWFMKREKDAPPVPRGKWDRQTLSAKPQNISGAIGGSRMRFLATMPGVLLQFEAEILRFSKGGSFPRWRDPDVADMILRYAKMLEASESYSNSDIRGGLDRFADWLIADAMGFISECLADVRIVAAEAGVEMEDVPAPPPPSIVLIRRFWEKDNYDVALKALTSLHFRQRESIALEKKEA